MKALRRLCALLVLAAGVACGRAPQDKAKPKPARRAEAGRTLGLGGPDAEETLLRLTDPETITELNLWGRLSLSPAAWRRVGECTGVASLSLAGEAQVGPPGFLELDDEVVRAISHLKGLEELVLKNVRGDLRRLLGSLGRPEKLRSLKIINAWSRVAGLEFNRLHLDGLMNLRLDAVTLDYTVIRSLRGLPQLRSADLSNSSYPDGALDGLRDHPTLNSLMIAHGQSIVGLEDVEAIATCPRLESLILAGTRVVPEALFALRNCRKLRYLWIGRTKLTRALAADLAGHLSLETLGISDAGIEEGALDVLARFEHLRDVTVGSLRVPDWAALAKIRSLETVAVDGDNAPRAMRRFRRARPDVSIVAFGG